jgi:bifunctional UDP-N-acetylglucosamine pyrophosphorylase/glucosamine-1-phosphate N-acetyltransferase
MLAYVLDLAEALRPRQTVCVLSHQYAQVKRHLPKGVKLARQRRLLGTADAVKAALSKISGGCRHLLVLYGDIPLLKKETLQRLLRHHLKNNLDATVLVFTAAQPKGYGRILRDKYSSLSGIVEEDSANDLQKEIKELNSGIICFKKERLVEALRQIRPRGRKREFCLTDSINILYKKGCLLDTVSASDSSEASGVNSRLNLSVAQEVMRRRINEKFMEQGVTLIDPASIFISYGSTIGEESIIYPFTVIENDVKIGKRCLVGPFAHLREGTRLQDEVVLGNFLEVVRSKISKKTLAKHFAYLGDASIGRGVNIGAGTVTANFDQGRKNCTRIADGAFIGSDSVLIAPVKIGRNAKTGAGAVLAKGSRVKNNQVVVGVPARPLRATGPGRKKFSQR